MKISKEHYRCTNHDNSVIKTVYTILLTLVLSCTTHSQEPLKLSDFELVNNTSWKGELTYKDYQSGNPTTIDATMQIKIKGEKIETTIQYTYEPNKNNKSSVKIKKEGTYLGNEKVIGNTLENGMRTFITVYQGKDNGKKATIYITHQFSESIYNVTKEVSYEDTEERFIRNTYKFSKL